MSDTQDNDRKVTDLDAQIQQNAQAPVEKKRGPKAKADGATENPAVTEQKDAVAKRRGLSGKTVDITIHNGNEGEIGKKPVDVSINGYRYAIKRNVRVTVPIEVVKVLQCAIRTEYATEGNKEVRSEVPRHPMTIHTPM
jgi:hypothetical protein